ncbi:actin-like ATPase domain-containing protein [Daedalea quercina L-15889]|uniref:Actin-like ATPase domain-containing protein n=1 Tax=Daedalea quercina L-15889 TaxID=1314783 RepID=A0A165PDJ0_9APHY|nr:actin-like ATPase domain-containing protein [Daedalea quercina L-15889]
MLSLYRLCFLITLVLSTLSENVLASVLAIDYGADWIKASLMKPGVPFDVLLNKDSKRKIQSTVGWKQSDRLFGGDAAAIAGRYPQDTFSSLKFLQAVPYESSAVSFYKSISTADLVETDRGTVALRRSDGTQWTVEELIAMQLSYVKQLAEDFSGEKIYDAVVTVPPYYTMYERDAVADAIEISGMRTLALVNDGTAVAVNYAMTRTFSQPEYHVIYDAGASAIRATVVGFSSVPSDPKSKSLTKDSIQITVEGVGFDRTVGGTELDRRLREIMISDFNRKHKKDIRQDKRGMAKLWKEAGRVKAILSANTDAMASVESLAWDIDYRSKITRADFEIACKDLKGEFARPIFDALASAGMTLNNISSVILTGGASRTPMIQAAVKAAVGESKIALNVNADEAAVLGAALHGASLSKQFKTKDIRVADISPYDIQTSYTAENKKAPNAKPRTISTLVFPAGTKTGTKKTLTLKRADDFPLKLSYKSAPAPGLPTDLLVAKIGGVAEAMKNLTEMGATEPVVKATLRFSDSGFVSVTDAVAYGEIKDDSLTGKLKGLFAGKSGEVEEGEAAEGDQATFSVPSSAATSEQKAEDTITLDVQVDFPSLQPLSMAAKRTSRSRLAAIDNDEAGKRRREEARNSLESYLYKLRDLLDDDNPESPFVKCSQEPERRRIAESLKDTSAWLSDYGDDADTKELVAKRSALESLEKPIFVRYEEVKEFPHTLNMSQLLNWQTRMFLKEARDGLAAAEAGGPPSKWTAAEIEGLQQTLEEHEIWLNEWVEKQKKVAMNEDPAILTSEMRARAKPLENALLKLKNKKAPKVPKKTTSTGTSASAESTETSQAESKGDSSRSSSSSSATQSPNEKHIEL